MLTVGISVGFGAGSVVGVERLQHFLDGGAEHGALSGVARARAVDDGDVGHR